ncbi:SDR family NAD(P)-dependent oxidoreductase [uncultured Tistrella sp.]|uniref:SDR family NAD(P)-dependent oxidoreductase n=1 Tax=Tistrella mobilis TaxID=171437 RepID=UPI000C08F8E2|nr:glucose 1-dehydrogenase [uncultured Tistrella sp.]MAM73608.1 2-deoxy-D-gluconate 3-dehydrogenase [Tistrella sp.]
MSDTTAAVLSRFSLAGRKALVTGASRGIGRALATGLAGAGAAVAVSGRDEAALEGVIARIIGAGGRAVAVPFDVSSVEQIHAGVAQAAEKLGGLDILVNNAGMEQVCPSLDVDEALWDRIQDTNLKGAFFCAQAAARIMSGAGGGAIINLCSLTSEVGVPTAAAYGASKSGLLGLTRTLATEWAGRGIRVNGIGPGYFRTDMTEVFFEDEAWARRMQASIPAGRFGEVDDLIGAAVFLASPAAAYVTGTLLYVDGGYMASI